VAGEGETYLFGSRLTRRELRRRVGRLEQVAGVTPLVLDEGPAHGVRALRFHTGGGLAFDVLPDRGMDFGSAEYKGLPLAWLSHTGGVAPSFYEPEGEGWLRSFGGGLLVTCGLQNVGPPGEREGERLGLHGRISHTPASNVSREARWDEEGCVLLARREVRESRMFGPNLMLRRTVSARLGEPKLRVEDEVENEGFRPEPLMLLYHVNLGWPLLDETARLLGPGAAPEPRDEEAAAGLESWDRFAAPTPGFAERVFYHGPVAGADGWAEARLENPALGLGLSVRFRPEELSQFVQWTMTGEGTYVAGLEPATCWVGGYEAEEAAGRVIWLEPGEARRYRLEVLVAEVRET
jgi:galactose mutarotase-like enzyme